MSRVKTDNIQLGFLKEEHVQFLKAFRLPQEQEKFTTLPDKPIEDSEGAQKVVILSENTPVGFFQLQSTDQVKEYSSNPNALLLSALSINYTDQGKGYAKHAMSLLSEFVTTEFPHIDEIILAVNQLNIPAQKLYTTVGFQDTQKRKIGPIGEQMIMSMKLK